MAKLGAAIAGNVVEPGYGTRLVRGGFGVSIEAEPRDEAITRCPHTFGLVGVSNTSSKVVLRTLGSIDPAGLPMNGVVADEVWDSGTISNTDTKWIRAYIQTDGVTPISWELEASDDPAPPIGVLEGVAPAELWIDLAVFTQGTLRRIVECGHLRVTALIAMTTDKETPACEEVKTVSHYTWKVENRDT